ncbi:hypothetical protein XA68_13129 [Ophiocordyceps unilateralis]|uniref:Uncharacterized protein n=1 Tax=Ophiocordyceps unilateralis TaxID=268505 RepID=A0A2A9PNU1_OPHUN|nr:hypothetical protein XA68_13129 [Ophiocordyceps unilateralis]
MASPPYTAESLFDVRDLVVVVTGGGGGLGRIMAHSLAANGAKAIYLLDINSEGLAAAKHSSPAPDLIHTVICDVTDKESLAAAAGRVRGDMGYCDVVFANAGVLKANTGQTMEGLTSSTPITTLQEKLWAPTMDEMVQTLTVNVAGVYFTAVAFLDLLHQGNQRAVVPQKSQVIVTSSVAGFSRVASVGFAYHASKAGATLVYKSLATILAPFKIRVNAVVPGFFPTDMARGLLGGDGDPRCEGAVPATFSPLERAGTEEEMAGAVNYLVSRSAAYVNGNALIIDGGYLAGTPSTY